MLGVFGDEVDERAQDVVDDLYLSVAADASPDADGGDAYFPCNQGCQWGGDGLHYYGEGAGFFQSPGIVKESGSGFRGFALYLESAELVD